MTTFALARAQAPYMGRFPGDPTRDVEYALHCAAAWSVICWLCPPKPFVYLKATLGRIEGEDLYHCFLQWRASQ